MSGINASKKLRGKAVFFIGLFCLFSSNGFAEGQFSSDCHSFQLKLPYLHARCRGLLNTVNRTRININHYIGVRDGDLVWKRYGNFMHHAKLCTLVGTHLGCAVFDFNKRVHYSVIDLDEHIGNFYGNLVYQGP